MKEDSDKSPEFLRELELEAPELAALPLDRLSEHLPEAEPPPGGKERLLEETSSLPLRYAPFFDRLSELWDLREDDLRAELTRAKNEDEWRWAALPGIRLFDVQGGEKTSKAQVRLVRFAPGIRFPAHVHKGHEQVLVLEGSYTDSGGTVYRSGDLHEMSAGSEHGFVVDEHGPCIAAVVEEGREFRSIFLRALAKFVRDG
jgi:anti-sigma factor ChrR (cupin superfamily)